MHRSSSATRCTQRKGACSEAGTEEAGASKDKMVSLSANFNLNQIEKGMFQREKRI
jgi:hypothetical protein